MPSCAAVVLACSSTMVSTHVLQRKRSIVLLALLHCSASKFELFDMLVHSLTLS